MQTIKGFLPVIVSVTLVTLLACGSGNNKEERDTTTASIADTVTHAATADSLPGHGEASASASDSTVQLIKNSLVNDLVKNDLKLLKENDRKFSYSVADINGDGKDEIFVGMKGQYFCGNAGCTVYLLNAEGKKIGRFTIVDGPITISATKTNGWNDLILPSKGINYSVKFNGKTYPSNPSVQPKVTAPVSADLKKVLADTEAVHTF
jgi:hypothetical protein